MNTESTHYLPITSNKQPINDLIISSKMLVAIATDADLHDYDPLLIRHFWQTLSKMFDEFLINDHLLITSKLQIRSEYFDNLFVLFNSIKHLSMHAKNSLRDENGLQTTEDYLRTIELLLEQAQVYYQNL